MAVQVTTQLVLFWRLSSLTDSSFFVQTTGEGVMQYPDGGKYEGEWQYGLRCGHGAMTKDGEQYIAEWRDDAVRDDCLPKKVYFQNWTAGQFGADGSKKTIAM